MELMYLVAGIGGLLMLTVFANNMAEIAEKKARDKKMKILRLQRRIDELSDYLEELKSFNLPKPVIDMILNEILVRFEMIQDIDPRFHGIQELLDESKEQIETTSNQPPQEEQQVESELMLQTKLAIVRHVIQYLQEVPLLSKHIELEAHEYIEMLITLRYEKINQFYFRQSQLALEENKFVEANKHIKYISNAILNSGFKNERLDEIVEQANTMEQEIEARKSEYEAEQKRLREERLAREEAERLAAEAKDEGY